MPAANLKRALELIEMLEQRGNQMREADASALLAEVFRACGHTVKDQGWIGGDRRADCYVDTEIGGRPQRIVAEIIWFGRPIGVSSVQQAIAMLGAGPPVDRSMVIARDGFLPVAIELAEAEGLGKIDLLAPGDLRNWVAKFEQVEPEEPHSAAIIRAAMAALAEAVAQNPEELWKLEWRDLERVLGVALNAIGFETTVTRSGKDGGFDLELRTRMQPEEVYLVEVKHWAHQKPGSTALKKLIKVTASQQASGGLLLSSSGFARTVYSGVAELNAPVRLGDGSKIVGLCKAYYRLQCGLWLDGSDAKEALFSGTVSLGEHL
jgi:hypothetical protein